MTYYASRLGVQGIRDSSAVEGPLMRGQKSLRDRAIERYTGRGRLMVQQRDAGGNPQGFWPAALRGRLYKDVPVDRATQRGKRRSSRPSERVESAQVEPPQTFVSEVQGGGDEWVPQRAGTDVLYFDGGFSGPNTLAKWAQRFQVPRTSHKYNESWVTPYSYGAQHTQSGPEGTLVLFPLHLPRRMGSVHAIGRSTVNRPMVPRTGVPGVTVVQASGQYP